MNLVQILIQRNAKQENRPLRFEEICRYWSQAIEYYYKRDIYGGKAVEQQYGLKFEKHDRCIVAEAHGFKGSYYDKASENFCERCSQLSVGGFCNYAALGNRSCREKFEMTRQQFVDHWNECHVGIKK